MKPSSRAMSSAAARVSSSDSAKRSEAGITVREWHVGLEQIPDLLGEMLFVWHRDGECRAEP